MSVTTRMMGAGAAAVALLLAGCDLAPQAPVVEAVGPTAPATEVPVAEATAGADIEAAYADAEARIDELLQETAREPIDVLTGTVPGTDDEFEIEVLSVSSSDLSLVLHLQLRPAGDEPLDLSSLTNGLSGELADGTRYIADIALADEGSDLRVLPTVYRPEVGEESADQRCMCSSLPQVVPPEGVRLTAHYVRPTEGFRSVVVDVPGTDPSVPIGID